MHGPHLDRRLREAARADGDGGRPLVGHQRVEHDRAVHAELGFAQPLQDRGAADLLLPLDEEAHVHGQLARAGELAGHVQQRQVVALVVGRPARVQPPVADGRLERRRGPRLERARVLHVVVAVGQHRRRARAACAQLAECQRVAAVDDQPLHAATRRLDPLADPVAGARERRAVGVARGHRGDAQPVDELVEE